MRLNVEFMQASRSSASRGTVVRQSDRGLFWWVIGITLLIGAAITSWFLSICLFSFPERTLNYNILRKLNKLPDLTVWKIESGEETSVPTGKFLSPRDLFQEFDRLTDEKLAAKSALLKRSYITNYVSPDERPVYVKGKFRIYHVRPLTDADVFQQGIVVRAQALAVVDEREEEFPNTILEFVFPTKGPAVAAFNVNDVLEIDTSKDRRSYASVINLERVSAQKLLFTVVPLVYGKYDINKQENLALSLTPPTSLNMNGKWPITEEMVGSTAAPTPRVVAEEATPVAVNDSKQS
jgi:hypothetical protein